MRKKVFSLPSSKIDTGKVIKPKEEDLQHTMPTTIKPTAFSVQVNKEDRVIQGDIWADHRYHDPCPVLFLCHGFKGFKDWGFFPYVARTLAENHFIVLSFNFSMNGIGDDPQEFTELERFARNTYTREQEDLSALLQQLKKGDLPGWERMDISRLGIIGHSRGGGNALLFSMEHQEISAVALWNSVAGLNLFTESMQEEMQKKGRTYILNGRTGQKMPIDREVLEDLQANHDRFDLLHRLPDYHKPILILQGEEDQAVPVSAATALNQAAPHSEMHLLPQTGHTFDATHPFQGTTPSLETALSHTIDFFKKNFK